MGKYLSRRTVLKAIGASLGGVLLAACGGDGNEEAQSPTNEETGFSTRFAHFEPAPEPNGDLSKVVWPDFVRQASSEVQRLYAFQVQNGDLMRYMPCFCGCGDHGHRNNRDCYVKRVNAEGTVVFDSMAPT